MFHVGHAGCLNAKVINDKAKGDVTPHGTPKARHVLSLIIASDGKAFLKEFVCKDASLWEPVHTLANFDITHPLALTILVRLHLSINSWGRISSYRHMYSAFHWGVQIEIGKIYAVE
jgi:hypothetical protein